VAGRSAADPTNERIVRLPEEVKAPARRFQEARATDGERHRPVIESQLTVRWDPPTSSGVGK
jgi:hypothetical protein